MKLVARLACLLFFFSVLSYSQNVSSSLQGVVVDPSGAPVPGAACNLSGTATGLARASQSGADGSFTFLNLPPGAYDLAVEAPGFRRLEMKGIDLTASELRTLGQIKLQLGEVRQTVSVTAESAAIQLGSAERSGTIDASQLNDVAIRGRDLFDLFRILPGVVDTSASRESVNRNSLTGIFVNGTRDNQKNATVDGMTNMDTGSNAALLYEPNMDSIQEIKILTSGYPAEYGRNSGAVITMVTKSGQKEFHGTAYDFYRHESLNANSFFNNSTRTAKLPYRYRITGYSLGGPIVLPGRLKAKDRLFFFFTQEFTGGPQDNQNWQGTKFVWMPTEAERAGDFSKSVDARGTLLRVNDPLTGQQFPLNQIPANRINPLGQAILKFFPLPNYVDPDQTLVNQRNYRSTYVGHYPRRQEMIRIDANLRPSITLFYRFLNDNDLQYLPWTHWVAGSVNYLLTPVKFNRPASGQVVRLTSTLSPTLVNEFTFGYNQNSLHGDLLNPEVAARSLLGTVPQWYQDGPGTKPYIPNLVFGGVPAANAPNAGLGNIPYDNWNHIYSFVDNLSKVWKTHQFKIGTYIEHTGKYQVGNGNYRGAFDFTRDTSNPYDTGHSFANALLGKFRSYSEATARLDADWWFWNVEWYVQDNWRVNKRLTLDVGLRFYHLPPTTDRNGTMATFDPRYYDPAKAPALYVPALNATGKRVAQNPISLALEPTATLIGLYVPGSGDYANGSRVGGKDGYPAGLYTAPALSLGPRFGFAYDVFGKGKTAIRGAFGIFGDRTMGNPTYYTNGNPPVTYSPTAWYGDLATYAQAAGVIGPATIVNALFDRDKLPMTMKFNLGIQQRLGKTALDVSYVGGLSRHLLAVSNINPIPMFSHFDPRNFDPTAGVGKALPDNFLRPYRGYGEIRPYGFSSSSNYNSLQVSAQRRFSRGLQFGIAYTWSKTLGVAGGDGDLLSSYFPVRSWNYGPLNYDRTHMFVVHYIYSVPKLGARFHLSAWNPITWVLDNWQVSGITSFLSGAPFTPTLNASGVDITGSGETARITVVGDPELSKDEKTFYRNFKTEVFQLTPTRSFGNAGVGILRNPGVNNWDISVTKRIPMRSEKRYAQFRCEMFNIWNHTQFSAINSTAIFDAAGALTNQNFGAYTLARNPRQIQLSLRIYF
jgi:hypothetical protein